MKLTRAQKREKLEKATSELIEALLDWEAENERANLTAIEEEVLQLRHRFGQALARSVLEGQEAQQPVENPHCANCGVEMRYKGRKHKGVESRIGELAIVRGYYTCPGCQRGFFPPG